jgi:hypothetical protein
MSQQSQFATTKRSGKDPLTPIAAKNMIKDTNKGNVAVFAQLLDIKPDFYESRIATVIRQGLREVDSEPLTGQVSKDELYEKPLRKEGILCNIGEQGVQQPNQFAKVCLNCLPRNSSNLSSRVGQTVQS